MVYLMTQYSYVQNICQVNSTGNIMGGRDQITGLMPAIVP